MLDCAKSELMALAESKTPFQSLKDDLKPGGKFELLELCLKEGTENRFTLNNYTTALVENVNKRFPDVEVLTELELFTNGIHCFYQIKTVLNLRVMAMNQLQ
jgi:hypothetical protein